ncbi:MAG: hypothetical protein ACON4U_15080 [Myxococcota bacterium]
MIWFVIGCLTDKSSSEFQSPSWSWLSTDPHVHSSLGSNDTDGLGTPNRIGMAMENAGLDLIWMTDHSNSQGSMNCDDVEDCPNQGPEMTEGIWPENVILASEISLRSTEDNLSTPVGHIGCLPSETESFSDTTFTDRPFGEIAGEEAVKQCQEASGLAILNHPFGPTSWVSYDWSSLEFDGMEVYNGGAGFDSSDEAAVLSWEEGIKNGYRWFPVGASDCHRWTTEPPGTLLDAPLGWPRTWIALDHGERSIEALAKGHTILGDPSTHLRFWAATKEIAVPPGGQIQAPASLFVEAHTDEQDMRLQVIDLQNDAVLSYPLDEHLLELQIEVKAPSLVYVRVWPEEIQYGQRGIAMGNVIEWTTK